VYVFNLRYEYIYIYVYTFMCLTCVTTSVQRVGSQCVWHR